MLIVHCKKFKHGINKRTILIVQYGLITLEVKGAFLKDDFSICG